MRFAAWLCVALMTGGSAWAQAGDRQDEIARLTPLYSIDLTHGDWQHELAAICPLFTRHTFVYYHRTPQEGVRTSFMAIVPVQGGAVTLVPLVGRVDPKAQPAAASKATIATFNAMWSDELNHTGDGTSLPGLTWAALAKCYAGVIGEQPVTRPYDASLVADPYVDLKVKQYHVSSMMIPVAAPGSVERAVGVQINAEGMVTSAEVSETVAVVSIMKPKK